MTTDLKNFQDRLVALVDSLEGPLVPYAQTYARNVLSNVAAELHTSTGQPFRDSVLRARKAVMTQLYYVVSNLEQVDPAGREQVKAFCAEHGFDLTEAFAALEEDETEGELN